MKPTQEGGLSVEDAVARMTHEGEDTPTPEADDATPEEGLLSEESDEEVDDGNVSDETEAEDGQSESEALSTLEQLADAAGIDLDALYSVKTKAKVDGQELEVTLKDLVKSYQLEGHVNKKSMELSEKAKKLEEAFNAKQEEAQKRLADLDLGAQLVQKHLLGKWQSTNWDALRQDDPVEFASQWAAYQSDMQSLNHLYQSVQGEKERTSGESRQQLQAAVAEQQAQLIDKLPSWSDADVAKRETAEIRQYLEGTGYTEKEIAGIYDHRAVLMARKAMLFDKLQAEKPGVTNKVRTAPKKPAPGSPAARGANKTRRQSDTRKTLKRSGSVDDAVAYLMDRN